MSWACELARTLRWRKLRRSALPACCRGRTRQFSRPSRRAQNGATSMRSKSGKKTKARLTQTARLRRGEGEGDAELPRADEDDDLVKDDCGVLDPADWANPEEASRAHEASRAQADHGDGGAGNEGEAPEVPGLGDEQVEFVVEESSRMRSPQEALDIFKNLRAHVGAQLAGTAAAAARGENRRLKGLAKGGAA
eukprot:2600867-Pyramimonas_sp.AAC.1